MARGYLREVLPLNYELDSSTVHNFIIRARIFKNLSPSSKPTLQTNMNIPGYLDLVGMSQKNIMDKSLLVTEKILRENLEENNEECDIHNIMKYLKHVDDGFDYRICHKLDNHPSGIFWVTSSMIFNYEQY